MTSTSDNIAAIEKALEGVTKGEWFVDGYNMSAVIFRQHGKSHVTDWMRLARCDGDNANWKADAAYIAACSPDRISALLAEARKAEAVEQEIAELREALRPFAAVEPVSISTSDGHISSNAFRRARTLLNGGSDAQG